MISRYFLLALLIVYLVGCGSKDDADKFRFLQKGNQSFSKQDDAQAIQFYDEALGIDSAYVDAWYNKGLVYARLEDHDAAIYAFTQAVHFKPTYFQAYLNRAGAHYAVKQYYAALEDIKLLSEAWADSSKVDFLAGLVYTELQQYDLAIHAFSRAHTKDPDNKEIEINFGNIYYHINQFDSARSYLSQNFADNHQQAVAFNTLSLIAVKESKINEAAEYVDSALALEPGDAYYLNNKGYILLKQGRIDAADSLLNRSMRANPYNAWVYRNKGLLHFEKKEYPQAVRFLEKAYKMDATIDQIQLYLAEALLANGQHLRACEILAEADQTIAIDELQKQQCD